MRAICVHTEPPSLSWGHAPAPVMTSEDVRIAVHATAVNRADLLQRAGLYRPPVGASGILGLECAGVVRAVGSNVSGVQVGDRVCALLAGGGYAEEVVVDAGAVLPIADGMSFVEAAALPEVLITAWLNVYREAGLQPGERVVIHAGGSGVGTAAIQLLHRSGHPVFVTVGSDEKLARCLQLGASAGANRHHGSWLPAVRDWAGGGVDVILDPVGAGYLHDNMMSLNTNGRLVVIGLLGGRMAELDMGRLLVKRLRVVGSVLRSRSVAEKREIVSAIKADVWPDVCKGHIRPIIDRVLSIDAAEEAHALLQRNETFGKVVLTIPQT